MLTPLETLNAAVNTATRIALDAGVAANRIEAVFQYSFSKNYSEVEAIVDSMVGAEKTFAETIAAAWCTAFRAGVPLLNSDLKTTLAGSKVLLTARFCELCHANEINPRINDRYCGSCCEGEL